MADPTHAPDIPATRMSTGAVVALRLAVVCALAAMLAANIADDVATRRFFDNTHWTLSYSVAAVLAWLGMRTAPSDSTHAHKWLAVALVAYAFGQILWDIQVAVGWNPFPGPSDAFYVCLGLFTGIGLGVALFGLLQRSHIPGQRRAIAFDVAGLSVAVLALVLALYLPRRGNTELLPLAFLVLYPVVLLWAVCLALVMSLSMRLAPHRGWLLFILGLCGNTAVWLEWNSRTLDGTLVDGGFYNALFSVAAVTQGAGLYLLRLEVSTAPRVEAFCAGVMRLLPLIIVVLAGLAVLFTHTLPQVPDLMREISVVGAFVVVILASIRQSVLLTERERLMQAEHSLRLQQEAYRVLVEQAADGIFVADRQGRYVEVNKSGADMLGMTREEVLRIGMRDIVATEMNQSLVDEMRALLAGVTVHSRWQLKRKDGSVFDAEITGKMLPDGRLQGLVRDVSERKALEEQLRQAQKMEAIGTLAAGIAHDFNNLLMAIRGYTEIVAEDLGAQHVAQSSLGEIRKASSRAGQLVRQILAFSRPSKPVVKVLQLAEVVEEVVHLLRSTLPAGVEITMHLDRDAPSVAADASQLHQVLLNLGTNAWQAMEGHGGHIDFVLSSESLGRSSMLSVPPGMYACLRVIDSGVGMDRLTCDRIFEPFFTTKRSSGGTGLGLAFVHSIVSNHGGAITVNSAPSVGTTFTIYLPKAPVVATSEPELHTPSVAGRGRRVLYVDDEQPIVALMTEQLERSDFRVTGLTSAHVALTAIRAAPHNYDIVVCDYNMPKMSGLELLQELLTLRPDLPCILISGFVDEGLQTAAGAVGVTQIVQKPQSPAELCVLIDALTATVRHLPPHLASTF